MDLSRIIEAHTLAQTADVIETRRKTVNYLNSNSDEFNECNTKEVSMRIFFFISQKITTCSITILLFLLTGCESLRQTPTEVQIKRDPQSINTQLTNITKLSDQLSWSNESCKNGLTQIISLLDGLNLNTQIVLLDDKRAQADQLRTNLYSLFYLRINLRNQIKNYDSRECTKLARKALNTIRAYEEGLLITGRTIGIIPDQDADEKEVAFRSDYPAKLINPKYGKFEWKSGDIILDRGDSPISANIAGVGNDEHLFSHIAIVGSDSRGRLYVLEQSVDDTVTVSTIKDYEKDNTDPRMAIYRSQDPQLAEKAGRLIYDYVKKRASKIKYDFHMNDSNPNELFCSEVAQLAYRLASSGKVLIPRTKSEITKYDHMKQTNWLKRVGIPYSRIFLPGDIDIDPRFDLVAEYRYMDQLNEMRVHDVVVASIYRWMIQKNYDFNFNPAMGLFSFSVANVASLFPENDYVPSNIPKEAITANLEFEFLFKKIAAYLQPLADDHIEKHKTPMPVSQMFEILERYRKVDCEKYKVEFSLQPNEKNIQDLMHARFNSDLECPL